jgi:hypothetical protein
LVGVLGGCIFSPDKGKDPPIKPPVVYPKRDTPKNAVLFMTVAWGARDSAQIAAVYADDYQGSSNDLSDPSAQNLSFVKSDEVRAVGAMALSQNIVTATMDFGIQGGWFEEHYVSDPPDWRYVQIPSFSIYVKDLVLGEYSAKSPRNGETWIFEFTLRPTYPNGPSGEPVWEIVKWVESRAKL